MSAKSIITAKLKRHSQNTLFRLLIKSTVHRTTQFTFFQASIEFLSSPCKINLANVVPCPMLPLGVKMDGTVSQRCISKFKIEVRICIPAI